MDPRVNLTEHAPGILLAERSMEGTGEGAIGVRALLLLGQRMSLVLDTLARPEDMQPFVERADRHGLPLLVVLTHADYDHSFGAAAFANTPIIGQRLSHARLLAEGHATLAEMRTKLPGVFDTVQIVTPTLLFDQRLDIDLGGITVELHHLPGHTADSLLAYVPERGLLFAADCAEFPIPFVGSGPLLPWAATLRTWASRPGLEVVIPAHGPVSGPELLLANATYLEQLAADPEQPWQPPVGSDPWYAEFMHPENQRAMREGRIQITT